MSLFLACISWQSLPQHTSSCLYTTGDMQSYEDWVVHKKHRAISLEDCKRLYELTSCCVDCVFYRGNYISIFLSFTLESNRMGISANFHNSWIIGKNVCCLAIYQRKGKKKEGCIFSNRSVKMSCIVSDAQKSAYSTPTAFNLSGPLGPWENSHLFSTSYLNNWEGQRGWDLLKCMHSPAPMPHFSEITVNITL